MATVLLGILLLVMVFALTGVCYCSHQLTLLATLSRRGVRRSLATKGFIVTLLTAPKHLRKLEQRTTATQASSLVPASAEVRTPSTPAINIAEEGAKLVRGVRDFAKTVQGNHAH